MAIDGRGWQSIFFENVHRSTAVSPIHCRQQYLSMDIFQIYCRRQYVSMETFHNLLSPTLSIDRLPPSSIVQAIDHCWVYCSGCEEHTHNTFPDVYSTLRIVTRIPDISYRTIFSWCIHINIGQFFRDISMMLYRIVSHLIQRVSCGISSPQKKTIN